MDAVGYAAILTIRQHLSTTLQISVDYLSELPENEDCEATGTVSHIGKSTATATVQLRVKRTGRLAAQGTHVVVLALTYQILGAKYNAVSEVRPCVKTDCFMHDLLR